MKMTTALTAALFFGTLSLGGGLVIANDLPTRGPIPFATWDADGSGTIEEQEFNTIRERRQATAKTDGRMGRNMASAPTFAEVDSDADGRITAEELTVMQQGQASIRAMGRGHNGAGCAMKKTRGPGHRAMDEETRLKHEAFFADTTELRTAIAAKRAEKRVVMHSTNPDPDQAAQLTRELLELRSQMMAQAEAAGIEFGPGKGRGCGRGAQGPGCGAHM
ncbi:MAG: hypothetical protein L3J49_14610 [Desulfobulbaceae bacterium]|nr:hypothetical protein [Desulfobulbaceae bacterium]